MYLLSINKTFSGKYVLCNTYLPFKRYRINKNLWNNYDSKLDNSLSRAKNNILKYTLYNEFSLFYTQTISSAFDRSDLKALIKRFNNIVSYLRKKFSGSFYYLLVPEFHKDLKCWHLHGFLSSGFLQLKYVNCNGFYSIKYLNKLGFNSCSLIRSLEASSKYILKYITKENFDYIPKGQQLYFVSKGLKTENIIEKLVFNCIPPIHFDFKSSHVFKTTISEDKYYNFVTKLDNDFSYYYSKYVNYD